MKHKYLLLLLTLFTVLFVKAQNPTWTFNNNTLNGWTTFRLNTSYTPSSVILTTNGQNNPRLDHATANIDANLYKFAVIKMKVGVGGPTLLRINFGINFKTTLINPGSTGFETYIINMTDPAWTGTINSIQLAFRNNDGSGGGAIHNSNGVPIEIEQISIIKFLPELYVDCINGNDTNDGAYLTPLKTIPFTLDKAATEGTPSVFIKSGTYDINTSINISTNSPHPIVVSPEANGYVKFRFQSFNNFRFFNNAKNIEIKGFEIDGKSYTTDHWTILSEYVWQPNLFPNSLQGGGNAFQIEQAEDIKITNNVIHDFYQKAVNIEDGRYVTIKGNILYNIATTSLSGGHGIMRQQGSGSFATPDDSSKYRWDINGNLIFNVYQRIYSWVPSKGYLNMVLDEGKPILIDETPNHDQGMKARIKDNIVAFFKIDGIRIKPTNNLEVYNNSLYSTDNTYGDGITDTTLGYDNTTFGSPFVNFKCFNNAVDVNALKQSYELNESSTSTNATFGNNYSNSGTIIPSNVAINLNTSLFTNPENGNYNLAGSIPNGIGANPTIISELAARATTFNITIANDNWTHNHLKNVQTLLDNIPGVEDGINGNEPVFTDAGIYDLSDEEFASSRKAYYFSVNSTWKSANNVTNTALNQGNGLNAYDGKYEIITPKEYSQWYDNIKATYLRDSDGNGTNDSPYGTIRHGESIIRQNKIFNNNSLHVVEINSSTNYNQTVATNNTISLDGDILFDFNYTPVGNEVFDILTANTINSINTSSLFDRIRFVGYTGPYTLAIVTGSPNILRLTLTTVLNNNTFDLLNNIVLYPNPSKTSEGFYLNIEDSENFTVKMFTILGQEIPLSKSQHQMNITHFLPQKNIESGIYLIKIESENTSKEIKYILN